MNTKKIIYDTEALFELRKSISKLSGAVKVTFGPKGKNVLIRDEANESQFFTRDGFIVARSICLNADKEDIGAKMLYEIASDTYRQAGDGVTTSIILGEAIFNNALKYITAGFNINELCNGINKAVLLIKNNIEQNKLNIAGRYEIAKAARLASNYDVQIGELISRAYEKLGNNPIILVDTSDSTNLDISYQEGFELNSGYDSPYFVKNKYENKIIYKNPFIIIYDKKLTALHEILPILEFVSSQKRPLVIIAYDFSEEIISVLLRNNSQNTFEIEAVKSPNKGGNYAEILKDLACFTGVDTMDKSKILLPGEPTKYNFGTVEKIIIENNKTTFINSSEKNENLKIRINSLRKEIESSKNALAKQRLQGRLANLNNNVAIIHVGGVTESETRERKSRIEKAVKAVKIAVDDGIVTGGGIALLKAAYAIDKSNFNTESEKMGLEIIKESLKEPVIQIANNAGTDGKAVVEKVIESKFELGFEAVNSNYEYLSKFGICDPLKILKTALNNSASVVTLLLKTEAIITENN